MEHVGGGVLFVVFVFQEVRGICYGSMVNDIVGVCQGRSLLICQSFRFSLFLSFPFFDLCPPRFRRFHLRWSEECFVDVASAIPSCLPFHFCQLGGFC